MLDHPVMELEPGAWAKIVPFAPRPRWLHSRCIVYVEGRGPDGTLVVTTYSPSGEPVLRTGGILRGSLERIEPPDWSR